MKYLITFAVALLALASLALVNVEAGPACSAPIFRKVVQTQVVTPVVVTPVVQNVVVAQFVAVPVVVPTFAVGYDPYTYGVTQELKAIREELRLTRAALLGAPPPASGQPEVQPQTQPKESLLENTSQVPVPPHVQIMSFHCAACHGAGKAKGGVTLFSAPNVLTPNVDRAKVVSLVETQKMPPDDKPKVHPDDIKILKEWAGVK